MKVFLIIWITLLLSPYCLFPQGNDLSHQGIDQNYQKFRATCEQELNASDSLVKEEDPLIYPILSYIPEWLIKPLPEPNNTISVIGISDPGIDSTLARSQAIFRALFLASLMSGSTLNNVVDNYNKDVEDKTSEISGQYVDYFEFSSQAPLEIDDAKVLQEQYTSSGECIVLVEYPVMTTPKQALAFKTTGMINEFEKDGVYEGNSRIEITGHSQSNSQAVEHQYISRAVNGVADVESYYKGNLLTPPTAKLKYWQTDSSSQSVKIEGVKTDRGLWNAFLTAVIKTVTLEIRTQPGELKSASDNYSGKSESLNREAMTGILTFHLDQILLYDNKLWAILDQIKFSQP
jgi:hypothetical protein